jgi:hypothetical protein
VSVAKETAVIEVLTFFLALAILSSLGLLRELRKARRRKDRDRALVRALQPYYDKRVELAEERLGPPTEILPGQQGRTLYIWNDAHPQQVPSLNDVLIVSMTVAPEGTIEDMYWRTRQAS